MDVSIIPIYTSEPLGTIRARDGEDYNIHIGLDRLQVQELKEKSLDDSDTELQQNTSDRKRFGEGSYEDWYSKERTPYSLLSRDGALAAIAWFGPKPIGRKSLKYLSEEELAKELQQPKSDWHTIVYRAYQPYRGKGLMVNFVRFVMDDYRKRHPDAKLWAGVNTKNQASMALAVKLGFKQSEEHQDEEVGWGVMIEQ